MSFYSQLPLTVSKLFFFFFGIYFNVTTTDKESVRKEEKARNSDTQEVQYKSYDVFYYVNVPRSHTKTSPQLNLSQTFLIPETWPELGGNPSLSLRS